MFPCCFPASATSFPARTRRVFLCKTLKLLFNGRRFCVEHAFWQILPCKTAVIRECDGGDGFDCDCVRSVEARREAWQRRFAIEETFARAKPGRGHLALASLYRAGKVPAVVTQNIDNLHQASGVPPHAIVELHGNTSYALCLACARRYELADIRPRFEASGDAPDCACGGIIKTATVSFGQPMPADAMQRAQELAGDCDLLLVVGSSLVVWPAAGIPLLAKRNGATLVIVNREPTEFDEFADLVVRNDIGDALAAFVAH